MRSVPIKLIVHCPRTAEGRRDLANRMAEVHADFVAATIQTLDCPVKQKLELLQSVIDTVRSNIPPGVCPKARG